MTAGGRAALLLEAARYLWWEKPEQAVRRPIRVVAQVMNLGDYEDVQRLLGALGPEPFRAAIRSAEPGWFTQRSWSYWCYRLGLAEPGAPLPPMPQRRL